MYAAPAGTAARARNGSPNPAAILKPRLGLPLGMTFTGFPEENVDRQGFALPPDLQCPVRAGLFLLHGVDQIEVIRQLFTIEGEQQVPCCKPSRSALEAGATVLTTMTGDGYLQVGRSAARFTARFMNVIITAIRH